MKIIKLIRWRNINCSTIKNLKRSKNNRPSKRKYNKENIDPKFSIKQKLYRQDRNYLQYGITSGLKI